MSEDEELEAFIAARLAEWDEGAWEIHNASSDQWRGHEGERCLCGVPAERHREVAALRKLLAAIDKADAASTAVDNIAIDYYVAQDLRRILAAIWNEDDAYRPEWAPQD